MSFFVVCPLRNCECKVPKIGMNCNQSLKILFPFDSSRFSGQLSRIYKGIPKKDIFMFHEKKTSSYSLETEYGKEYGYVFFVSCPIRKAVTGPDKSGHRPSCCIIIKSVLRVCPDLRGKLIPLLKGMRQKRHIHTPMKVSFLNNPEAKRQGKLPK